LEQFDVAIVGAGPAGSSAAYYLASKGFQVILLERGKSPGSKNVFGGRIYPYSLRELIPTYLEDAPIERMITKEGLTFMTEDASLSASFSSPSSDGTSGFTVFRSRFDQWLAQKAVEKGAFLLNEVKVDDVLFEKDRIAGIVAGGDEIRTHLVIAADGATSKIAEKAGLRGSFDPKNFSIGIKEVIELPKGSINDRFQVESSEGVSIVYVGYVTKFLRGGGFLYTNQDSVSLGIVVKGIDLVERKINVESMMGSFKQHEAIRKLIVDGKLLEYSTHLIPEAGFKMMPRLFTDGLILVGDAAGFIINNGYTFRGVDLAIASGIAAAETFTQLQKDRNTNRSSLSAYLANLDKRNVISDLKKFKNGPSFLNNPRLYAEYPKILIDLLRTMYSIDGRGSKRVREAARETMKRRISITRLVRDLIGGMNAI